jgi:hypothetical protein
MENDRGYAAEGGLTEVVRDNHYATLKFLDCLCQRIDGHHIQVIRRFICGKGTDNQLISPFPWLLTGDKNGSSLRYLPSNKMWGCSIANCAKTTLGRKRCQTKYFPEWHMRYQLVAEFDRQ